MNKDEDFVHKPSLTTRALIEGLQMAHELVNRFFEVGHLMNRFLIFNHEEAFMAPYKEVYKDMQKKGKQLHSLLSLLSFVSPSAMHSTSSEYPDNFQPGTLSYQQT